ncbi:MAG: hypothetical protein LBD11_04560 [Candidatus Peribacteria bacterium]|jgi:hypothetical protein|nr:hypothetical protein [Candidatus Peribacteria bacterium]
MYQRFLLRYGDKGNFSEIEFKTELLEALKTQNALDKLGVDPYSGLAKMYGTRSGNSYAYLDEILDDYIQEHQGRLSVHEIPLFPYKKFDKYEQEFTNTLLSDKEIILR